MVENITEVTAEDVRAVQELHQRNPPAVCTRLVAKVAAIPLILRKLAVNAGWSIILIRR